MSRRGTMSRVLMLHGALALVTMSPCAGEDGRERHAAAQEHPILSAAVHAPSVDAGPTLPAVQASQDVPVTIRERPLVTPITPSMVQTMRQIAERDPTLRSDVFAKMGGSSVVNHGFLHCFEEEPAVDFGGRPLGDTLAYFLNSRVGSRSPFTRSSAAAAVGWSIRHALGGRPPYVVQELRTTQARWALAFFGSNDVEGKNAHQFAGRLDRLLMTITERGVVPIVGATYPRRANDPDMNEQVRRYNRMSAALASAWGLAYVDFHQPMMGLPGRGLAGDGYHPNTYIVGPRSHGCDFGPEGMRYGNNHRNLLTLTALDAVRRTLVAGEPPQTDDISEVGVGSAEDPFRVVAFPFARRIEPSAMPQAEGVPSDACAVATTPAQRVVARFTLDRAMRIRASAVAMGPLETHVGIRRVGDERCFGRGEDEEVVTLDPGTYELHVFASRPRRVAADLASVPPRILIVLDAEPGVVGAAAGSPRAGASSPAH